MACNWHQVTKYLPTQETALPAAVETRQSGSGKNRASLTPGFAQQSWKKHTTAASGAAVGLPMGDI